jgi:two-component system, LuxR family, response regulator FixJ
MQMEKGVVFVVDDDPAVCRSIATMVQVMGLHAETFDGAERFLDAVPYNRHGCLIADIRMLGMSGVQLLGVMADRGWKLPTIVVTAYADVRMAVQTIRAGATTLLEKPYRDQELWDAIMEAMAISERSIKEDTLRRTVKHRLSLLTNEEMRVLQEMINGTPNKLIAKAIDIAPRTVDLRRQSVLKKMEASSAIHLIRLFSQAGIFVDDRTMSDSDLSDERSNGTELAGMDFELTNR